MKTCPICGNQNADESNYCVHCGENIANSHDCETTPPVAATEPSAYDQPKEEGNMFSNIGGKIKSLARVLCWIGIIGSILVALIGFSDASSIGLSIVLLIIGPLASWVNSFFIYGFGELIEKTTIIASNISKS